MHLLICSQEPLGERMAGPGIRATELARALDAEVVLAAPKGGDVFFHPHDPGPLRAALKTADAVLSPPLWPRLAAALGDVPWICDLYAPEPLETLEHFRDRPPLRRLMSALALDRLDAALERSALLLCATDRQRDLWTGALLAARGLSPAAYDADPTLERLLVVPFGLPAEPPVAAGRPIRERFAIPAGAPVVLWNGGTWPWLDPEAAVAATLAHADAHLVFMGGADARVAPGPRVHVNEQWVPYEERGAWLLDADVVISAHHDHLETRYAFRTRLLDALWAGRPIVCTAGDELADLVEREDLGAAGGPLADGLARVLDNGPESYRDRIATAAATLTWPRVAAPLDEALARPLLRPRAHRTGHPARGARTVAYRTARPVLDRLGLRDWPRA